MQFDPNANPATFYVLEAIEDERDAQDAKWGEQNHPDYPLKGRGWAWTSEAADDWKLENHLRVKVDDLGWDGILLEEVYEALAESDQAKLREELIQVAAVAVAWIECIDRRENADSSQGSGA